MPIELKWYNDEKTIIFHAYSDKWSLNDFYTADDEIKRVLYTVSSPVIVIIDFTEAQEYPEGAEAHFTHMAKTHHSMVQHFIIVAPNDHAKAYLEPLFTRVPRLQQTATLVTDRNAALQLAESLLGG